ncbi:transcriptional regulator [Arthrobacter pityocampae]|uniref:transcriptional regulator n=1 Tax=Arthrobacter pityocampae TaxID=547334 RepID=UPI0037356852
MDVATLRGPLQVTDSVLSKQVIVLETAGYARGRRGDIGKRPRTSPKRTKEGDRVRREHLSALLAIAFPVAPVDPWSYRLRAGSDCPARAFHGAAAFLTQASEPGVTIGFGRAGTAAV